MGVPDQETTAAEAMLASAVRAWQELELGLGEIVEDVEVNIGDDEELAVLCLKARVAGTGGRDRDAEQENDEIDEEDKEKDKGLKGQNKIHGSDEIATNIVSATGVGMTCNIATEIALISESKTEQRTEELSRGNL